MPSTGKDSIKASTINIAGFKDDFLLQGDFTYF